MATLVRDAQGQLTETDPNAQDTQSLAKLQGMPVTPTSPAGVKGIGGTPDQSKMAGTPAQKAPVLQQQTAPAQTLQTAQRTAAPEASSGDEEARQKAEQLQSLGSLQTRVQALINKDLTLKSPASGQVDQTNLQAATGGLSADKQAQAQALIQQIGANPNDKNAVAQAAQFWVDNGLGTVDTFSPDKFLASAQSALSTQAQQQVNQATGNQVTLKDVGLTDAESQNLTQTFGDGWQGMTVPQLTQKIEDMRQAEYNRVAGIKAQLMTATGTERQQLTEQLASAGQAGATGAEQQMQHLSQAVGQGDTVTIGGEEHKVEDLLKDGQVSDLVTRMLNDPALAGKVAQSNPDFASWVNNNKTALEQLSQKAAATMGGVRSVNQQKQQLATVGNTTLTPDVMKSLVPDWDKITASAPDTSKSGILQTLQNTSLDQTTRQSMATALNGLKHTDPDTFDQVKGLDAGSFQHAWDFGQEVAAQNDPTNLLADISGAKGGFVTDPKQQQLISKYKPVADALAAVYSQPGMHDMVNGANADLFKQQVLNGNIKAGDVKTLAANPGAWDNFVKYHDTVDKFKKAYDEGDIGTVLNTVFGHTTSTSQINDAYTAALKGAKLGDPDAQKKVDAYKQLDKNGDGVIDVKDINSIGAAELGAMGGNGSFKGFLEGQGQQNSLQSLVTSAQLDTPSANGDLQAKSSAMDQLLKEAGGDKNTLMDKMFGSDGQLTEQGKWMESLPDATKQQYGIPTQQQLNDHTVGTQSAAGQQALSDIMGAKMGDMSNIADYINSGKYWDGAARLDDIKNILQDKQKQFLQQRNQPAAAAFDQQLTQINQLIAKNQANQQAAANPWRDHPNVSAGNMNVHNNVQKWKQSFSGGMEPEDYFKTAKGSSEYQLKGLSYDQAVAKVKNGTY